MVSSREVLMSAYRAGRMKKVRKSVYYTLIALTIVIIILFTMITPMASFSPLYLPFEVYLFVIVIMLLIANVVSMLFMIYGIKWARTESEKFLMAKGYMKKGIIIATGAILIMGVVNVFAPVIDEGVDENATLVFEDTLNRSFRAQDSFAITGVTKITVLSEDDPVLTMNVYILRKENYEKQFYARRVNLANQDSIGISQMSYEKDSFLPQDDYVLFINASGQVAKVTYTIERSVADTFLPYFTIFPIVFAGMNGAWVGYLVTVRRKYGKSSIYE
jgi:hypothetical protein